MNKGDSMLRFILLFLAGSLAFASDNVLMPNLQLNLTPPTSSYGAISFLGEVGSKNFRGSGTYGAYITSCQRFKVTGEFLTQKINFSFPTEKENKWVSQYAVGGEYQYILPSSPFQSIDLGGYYSHAFKKGIDALSRIAGSDGGSGYLGTTVKLWNCAFFSLDINYDHVKYHRHFQSDKLANGWGSSGSLVQLLPKDLSFKLDAELRRPFFFYEGSLNWNRNYSNWGVNCGVYANYTQGKEGLPNIVAGGLQLGFSFGGKADPCCRRAATVDPSSPSYQSSDCGQQLYCDLTNWVRTPSVYVPIVQVIPDSNFGVCIPPTSSSIPDQSAPLNTNAHFDVSGFFYGSAPLTYVAINLPAGLSINASTGVISGIIHTGSTATVTATNGCGSTSQTFSIVVIR
jgi:hypothetical protein